MIFTTQESGASVEVVLGWLIAIQLRRQKMCYLSIHLFSKLGVASEPKKNGYIVSLTCLSLPSCQIKPKFWREHFNIHAGPDQVT